ncbi:MAG: hypothetical protein R2695_14865 [Acidimicrobiales bacterium]
MRREYVEVPLPHVPPHLADEAAWQARRGGRDLVEADPTALAGIRRAAGAKAATFCVNRATLLR